MNDTFYNFALVADDRGWVGIDRNDSIILRPFIFDNEPDDAREAMFRFEENGKMGFANLNGIKVIPAVFDFVEPFKNGYAAFNTGGYKEAKGEHWFWRGGLWGFINKNGNVIIEPQFENFTLKDKKYIQAYTKDGRLAFINEHAQIVKVTKMKKQAHKN